MQTPNQGESVDSAAPQVPQKVGAIPGLKTKIMTALAAVGLAASVDAQGAITLTPTNPTRLNSSSSIVGLETSPAIAPIDARLRTGVDDPGTLNVPYQGTARFTVTVPTEGTLTITWDSWIGMGTAPGDGSARGFANATYYVDQRVLFGPASGVMSEINLLQSPRLVNSSTATLSGVELWNSDGSPTAGIQPTHFSETLLVNPGVHNFDFTVEAMNASTYSQVDNLNFSFEGIPEPSTTTLLGGAAAALLLRRKREDKIKKEV